ncbi:hypothetical protein Daus18300_013775 [Diaporthe australafricana]|uniref:NACHT domain-containing protein n=1 Tax=Diaporthe australafricana TaxID=127596 RepID=A0ABR3VXS9_9PEZI
MALKICAEMNKLLLIHSDGLKDLQYRSERLQADQRAGLGRILSSLNDLEDKLESMNSQPKRAFTVGEIREAERQFSQIRLSENEITKEQAIVKSLALESLPARYEAIAKAHRQTFKWVLKSKNDSSENCDRPTRSGALGRWLRNGEDVFWVSGKPGSGKSTLMKFIVTQPRTFELLSEWASPKKPVIVSHYFWNGGTPMQRSLHGLLQTLLYEVVRQCPAIIPTICPDEWADPKSISWTISTLRTSFENFVSHCKAIDLKFCFFIDGLDEYDGDHTELCKIFSGFAKFANIKVCLSSRPWNVFDEAFGHGLSKLYVHEFTKKDIRTYAASRLHGHPRWNLVITNQEDGQWLVNQIRDRAWGVFLWAVLVTKLLLDGLTNRDRFSDMRRRLNSFPTELEPFFKKILASHSQRKILYITSCYEFHDQEYDDSAYALNMASQPLTKAELEDIRESTISRLQSRTRGLLELQAQSVTVTFLHRTVMDFLRNEGMTQYLYSQVASTYDFNVELSILKAHLAIIKATENRGTVGRIGFGEYILFQVSTNDVYDDFDMPVKTDSYEEGMFHTVTSKALVYIARADAQDAPGSAEALTHILDDMDRVLAQLIVGDGWRAEAYFREQLVKLHVSNYLERKIEVDPDYVPRVRNLGSDLAV